MKEVWRDIPGWEGLYAVSAMGRVKSHARMSGGKERGPYKLRGRLMTQTFYASKACNVMLSYGDKRLTTGVGRLVLLAFVGEAPHDRPMAIHKDGNCGNNKLRNLFWGTHQEAEMLKIRHGRDGGFYGGKISKRIEDIEWRTNKNKEKVSVIT